MDAPQHSMNVWATLESGEEIMAYWLDGQWWEGVAFEGSDIVVSEIIVSWREVT
jgi:hypothetical protein